MKQQETTSPTSPFFFNELIIYGWDENHWLASLRCDFHVQGLPLPEETLVEIDNETGNIITLNCPQDLIVQNIPCLAAYPIHFYPNGFFKSAYLSKVFRFQHILCQSHSVLGLLAPTLIDFATLAEDQDVEGFPCKKDTLIQFHIGGSVAVCTPRISLELDHVHYQAGKKLQLFRTGEVNLGFLQLDQEINGIPCKGGTEVIYNEQHQLIKFTLSVTHILNGHTYPKDVEIWLDPDGKVERVL
jgi:hypothetical protein